MVPSPRNIRSTRAENWPLEGEADDGAPEQLLHLGVRLGIGAKPGAGQDRVTDEQEVALPLIDLCRCGRVAQTSLAKRAPYARPSITSPPLAAKTMSGRPGSANALLHMLAKDIAHLVRAIERVRDELNVDHTRSTIVLSRLIDRPSS